MPLNKQLLLSFLTLLNFSYSQNMEEGYSYLETGKYAKAETFFETILNNYPKNKTAKLCYGRAVGLNGESKKLCRSLTLE